MTPEREVFNLGRDRHGRKVTLVKDRGIAATLFTIHREAANQRDERVMLGELTEENMRLLHEATALKKPTPVR